MNPEKSHQHAKLAAELGLAGLGLAAAGFVGYAAIQKHRAQPEAVEALPYQDKLSILNDSRVERKLKNGRHIMASAAVRIYYASHNSTERVITKQQLWEQLQASGDESLHITKHQLQDALGFLNDHELIGRRPAESNPKSQGYYALPALEWSIEEGDKPAVVTHAETVFLEEYSSGNW
jgi:hypothetical protein